MDTLETLREKKNAYVKAEAQKIINGMVSRGVTTDTLATCDYPNWDRELHRNMPAIAEELMKHGILTSSKVNHGVTDWVFVLV